MHLSQCHNFHEDIICFLLCLFRLSSNFTWYFRQLFSWKWKFFLRNHSNKWFVFFRNILHVYHTCTDPHILVYDFRFMSTIKLPSLLLFCFLQLIFFCIERKQNKKQMKHCHLFAFFLLAIYGKDQYSFIMYDIYAYIQP